MKYILSTRDRLSPSLLPPGLSRDTASDFLVDNQDGEAKWWEKKSFGGLCCFTKNNSSIQNGYTSSSRNCLPKNPQREIPHEHTVINVSDPAERFCQVTGMMKRQEERPVGKSAVCLAWMVLSLVSFFHKIMWVNAFNLKEWFVQTRFCSIVFGHMVKGNLKKLHCEDSKHKSTIKNNQDYFLL